jgi:hypothetical protein
MRKYRQPRGGKLAPARCSVPRDRGNSARATRSAWALARRRGQKRKSGGEWRNGGSQ